LDTITNSKALAKGLDCASPESILDSLARSPAGDQYSLGCILYRCLTGRYPFPSDNPVKKMVAHQSEIPTSVRQLSPETPPALAAIVERLMEKAPEDRYESMGEVVNALQGIASPAGESPGAALGSIRNKPATEEEEESEEEESEEEESEVAAEDESDNGVQQAGPRSHVTMRMVLTGLAAGLAVGLLMWWLMRV
jgi:serine/threonine protein kinase